MSTTASYKVKSNPEGTDFWVETFTRWSKKDWRGKNMTHSGSRSGTIYTQSRFKAWLRKYSLPIIESEVALLPKTVY